MIKENIPERTNFADEVLYSGKRSLLDPKMNETFYKQENNSWIIINNSSGEYVNTNPEFQLILDNILQKKLTEELEIRP
jgi:hypothetical protein